MIRLFKYWWLFKLENFQFCYWIQLRWFLLSHWHHKMTDCCCHVYLLIHRWRILDMARSESSLHWISMWMPRIWFLSACLLEQYNIFCLTVADSGDLLKSKQLFIGEKVPQLPICLCLLNLSLVINLYFKKSMWPILINIYIYLSIKVKIIYSRTFMHSKEWKQSLNLAQVSDYS